MVSASFVIWLNRCSRIHGTAVNCTRWVSSCRHTHRRKSVGSAPISRSTWTMLGATSSSRPSGAWNGSNCPSTLEPRNPSTPPTSAPVILEPIAAVTPVGGFFSVSLSTIGVSRVAKASALACTHPARSTTSTGAEWSRAVSPVNSRTSPVERSAPARSSATAALASPALTDGPSPAMREPMETARSQSTISARGDRVMGPTYPGRGGPLWRGDDMEP